MKYRDIIKQVEADGWTLVKQKGTRVCPSAFCINAGVVQGKVK